MALFILQDPSDGIINYLVAGLLLVNVPLGLGLTVIYVWTRSKPRASQRK